MTTGRINQGTVRLFIASAIESRRRREIRGVFDITSTRRKYRSARRATTCVHATRNAPLPLSRVVSSPCVFRVAHNLLLLCQWGVQIGVQLSSDPCAEHDRSEREASAQGNKSPRYARVHAPDRVAPTGSRTRHSCGSIISLRPRTRPLQPSLERKTSPPRSARTRTSEEASSGARRTVRRSKRCVIHSPRREALGQAAAAAGPRHWTETSPYGQARAPRARPACAAPRVSGVRLLGSNGDTALNPASSRPSAHDLAIKALDRTRTDQPSHDRVSI